jgi:hypothetical protein
MNRGFIGIFVSVTKSSHGRYQRQKTMMVGTEICSPEFWWAMPTLQLATYFLYFFAGPEIETSSQGEHRNAPYTC